VTDLCAVDTIGAALEGSGKPFVGTSGTLPLAMLGRLGTGEDAGPAGVRWVESENAAMSIAERGVPSSFVRLPPSVDGDGDKQGFVPSLIGIACAKGVSAFVGDGSNRWPAVHRLDAARLFRLAVETAAAGSRLHGAGEEGVPFRDIAEAIGRHLNLPVVSISREEADGHFGVLSAFVSADNATSSARTRELLRWQPTHPGLIDDLDHGPYFHNTSA
jgi:nucleoside-diphosphate-sugar epimerase